MDKKIQSTLPGGHSATITTILFGVSVLALAGLLSACSPSTSGTLTPTTVIASINIPLPTATPAPPSLQKQAAAPPAIDPLDPCVLIGSQEASAYAGSTFGPGIESTTDGGGKICTYGSETANVFMVEVAQAPDVATAQADKADFLATLQANAQQLASGGLDVTQLPNFVDGATMGQLSTSVEGIAINGSAIGVLKGTIFFGFSDVVKGGAAPSAAAVQAEATTLLGQLP